MQQPKRFQASTLAEAYEKVRRELGGEAVILSTRKAHAPGLFGQPGRQFVEVVAHIPAGAVVARPSLDQDMAAHELVRGVAEAVASGGMQTPMLAPPFANEYAGVMKAPEPLEPVAPAVARDASTSPEDMGDLLRQLGQMRGILEELVAERSSARLEGGTSALREIRDRLLRQGLAPAHIVALVGQAGGASVRRDDANSLARTLERNLAAKMPAVARVDLARRPAAIFLVGPGGAGKTTTAIRLALDIERAHELKVVVAGTDVNRAGAPQQLMAFGAATGMMTRLCYSPPELQELLAEGVADVVIVDTPGHNGQRRDRMAELSAFLQAARRRTTLLVAPATMKGADLGDVVSAFNPLALDGLVFTRCDETTTFGALASAAIDASLGVAYTTHSDQVSEAPRAGDHTVLASAVVSGRWPATPAPVAVPAAAPRRLATAV